MFFDEHVVSNKDKMLYTQHSIAILMVQCILVAAMYSLCICHVCYTRVQCGHTFHVMHTSWSSGHARCWQ